MSGREQTTGRHVGRYRRWLPRNLYGQIMLLTFISLAVVMLGYASHYANKQSQMATNMMAAQISVVARNLAEINVNHVLLGDLEDIENVAIKSADFPNIVSIMVVDRNGKRLTEVLNQGGRITVRYSSEPISLPIEGKFPINSDDENNLSAILNLILKPNSEKVVWEPIARDAQLGWVRISYTLKHTRDFILKAWWDASLFSWIAIGLVLFLLKILLRSPMRALQEATQFAERLDRSLGKQLQVLPITNELESLCIALNSVSTRLKLQDVTLQDSVRYTQNILDNVVDGIITIDGHGIVLSFNPSASKIFGYSVNEVVGNNVKMLMPEPYRSEHDGYLNNYHTSGAAKIIGKGREVVGQRKDGSRFPMDLAVSSGAHLGQPLFIGIVRDITERKQAEAKLEKLHREMVLLLESTGEGIYGTDAHGHCTFINGAAARMLGYTVKEMTGKGMHALIHHRHIDGSPYADEDCPIYQGLRTGQSHRGEDEVFWRKDQKPFPVEYASYPIIDAGRITGAVVTFSDITERKKTVAAISRFKDILDNTLDMVFMFNPETFRFVYINKRSVESLGYTHEDFLKLHPWEIKPQLPEHLFRALVSPLLNGDSLGLNYETVYRSKGGNEFPVEVSLQLVEEGNGERLFVAISRDLTERRKIDKLKNEFISTVSHELRTPLTSIRGALGLVRGEVAGELPAQVKPMIEIAYNNAERLVRLINDILDMEKIESGKMHFEMKETELMPLIEQALEANHAYGEQYRVRFTLAEGLPSARINVDSDRLLQVLANLLSNGAKFSPPDDEVIVTVKAIGTMVRISVSDHGSGIPEEFRGRIFQKFSQADSSETKKKGGTGLGLSITKAIIEKMGGIIGFDSVPGQGTTFYFELPNANA